MKLTHEARNLWIPEEEDGVSKLTPCATKVADAGRPSGRHNHASADRPASMGSAAKISARKSMHHILCVSDGGPEHPRNVIGVCPNCHRRAHYAHDRVRIKRQMMRKVAVLDRWVAGRR
jgi:HNH endonuclease